MRRTLLFAACCLCLSPAIHAQERLNPDGIPYSKLGGLIIIRSGNQTSVALGGVAFPRRVKLTTITREGPVVERFKLPSGFSGGGPFPLSSYAPAAFSVEMPADGVLYIEGELVKTHGNVTQLESPPLAPEKTHTLHLRAAYRVGDNLIIEDKEVSVRAGDNAAVTFTGARAVTVPIPREATEAGRVVQAK
jgi:uncharacterized protein (TIGR03000 family)